MFCAQAMPRVCATTATDQSRQPVDPVLSRAVKAHLKTFLVHTAWDAEHGDAGMSCTVLCAPLPSFLDMAMTQCALAWNGGATAVAPRTSVTPGTRTQRPDGAPDRMHCTGNCAVVLGAIPSMLANSR